MINTRAPICRALAAGRRLARLAARLKAIDPVAGRYGKVRRTRLFGNAPAENLPPGRSIDTAQLPNGFAHEPHKKERRLRHEDKGAASK